MAKTLTSKSLKSHGHFQHCPERKVLELYLAMRYIFLISIPRFATHPAQQVRGGSRGGTILWNRSNDAWQNRPDLFILGRDIGRKMGGWRPRRDFHISHPYTVIHSRSTCQISRSFKYSRIVSRWRSKSLRPAGVGEVFKKQRLNIYTKKWS